MLICQSYSKKKGRNINYDGSGSSMVKPVTTTELKNKGKGTHVEPSEEEKKRTQDILI